MSVITGKPTKVEFYKEYQSKNGTLYQFNVYLENDEKRYAYSSKSQDDPKIKQGVEAQFEIEEKSNDRGSWWVIKPHRENSFSKNGGYNSNGQTIGMAINNAVQLRIAGVIKDDQLESMAKRIIEISKSLEKDFDNI